VVFRRRVDNQAGAIAAVMVTLHEEVCRLCGTMGVFLSYRADIVEGLKEGQKKPEALSKQYLILVTPLFGMGHAGQETK
jgi:hypothetical protein